jgi:hypothetical protein
MTAQIVAFKKTSDRFQADDQTLMELIDHAHVRLIYCMAGWPDRPVIHRVEAMEAERLGHRLRTE